MTQPWKHLTPEDYQQHRYWMQQAIKLAENAGKRGDVPVGAIILDNKGNSIAESANCKEKSQDPTAHAEILALRLASQTLKTWHLDTCTLYVTLEPCPMCAGAIIQSRLGLLVYGVDDPKTGAIRTVLNLPDSYCSNHRLAVISGIEEMAIRQQLQTWFSDRRR